MQINSKIFLVNLKLVLKELMKKHFLKTNKAQLNRIKKNLRERSLTMMKIPSYLMSLIKVIKKIILISEYHINN